MTFSKVKSDFSRVRFPARCCGTRPLYRHTHRKPQQAAREEGETAARAAAAAAATEAMIVHPEVKARQAQLSLRLDNALDDNDDANPSNSEAESGLIEARQWEDAEAAWAREVEAGRGRERRLGAAREEAEVALERAERRLEGALAELESRDVDRQVCEWIRY